MSSKSLAFFTSQSLCVVAMVAMFSIGCSQPAPTPLLFGRALFGPDKTDDAMVFHFIVDGDKIYVDRNKDDVPQPDELFSAKELALLTDDDTQSTYRVHELRLIVNPKMVSEKLPQQLGLTTDIAGPVTYQQLGAVRLTPDPKNPDWIQFHGANHLIFADVGASLTPGTETGLRLWIGTNAIGSALELGSTAAKTNASEIQNVSLDQVDETQRFASNVPIKNEMVPQLKIEIPTDGSPFIETLYLDDFC